MTTILCIYYSVYNVDYRGAAAPKKQTHMHKEPIAFPLRQLQLILITFIIAVLQGMQWVL